MALSRIFAFSLISSLLLAGPVLQTSVQAQSLPSLGEIDGFTVGQERRIGDQIAQQLYRDTDYLDDPVLQEYVDDIWKALMQAAREKGALGDSLDEQFAWRVLLSKARSVNAFALPGGYFGLHLGLINAVGSKDELASVMAHELSHVSQRHISRMVAQQSRQTPILIASMILGALAASKSPDAAQAVVMGGHALSVQNYLDFSRGMEQEADRIGLGLMAPAKFDPRGFVLMFDKLYQVNRLNDDGAYPYLRTHPLTAQRLSDIQARMPDVRGHSSALALTPEHAIVVARSRILSRADVNTLLQSVQLAQQTEMTNTENLNPEAKAERIGRFYAGALAAIQLRDYGKAKQWEQAAADLAMGDPKAERLVGLLNLEAALAASDTAWIRTASGSLDAGVKKRPELLLRAQAQLQSPAEGGDVTGQLQSWLIDHPDDAAVWQLLAQIWSKQNLPLRALRAEAEVQVARLDYAAAIDRYKAGLAMVREMGPRADHVDASILTSRLRAIEELNRERVKDRDRRD